MEKIRKKIQELTRQYGTCELDELCEKMGIITIDQELPERVNGFTVKMYEISFIVLNKALSFYEKRLTKAHELGHIVLHNGTNTLNLSCNTSFCVTKYEKEADCFAAMLLIQSEMSELEGLDSVTAETVSRLTHIPQEIVDRALMI